jgi:hypothetical protein
MKPLFVSIKENQPVIHWPKLAVFACAIMVLTIGLVASAWFALAGHVGAPALILGLVFGLLIVIRVIARAVTYQEQELENIPSTT